jgi:cytochrome P450
MSSIDIIEWIDGPASCMLAYQGEETFMANPMPSVGDITLAQLYADPYPAYKKLRNEAPIAWVPAANIHLVTLFDDIIAIERDFETFPANDKRSLQIKAMGHTLMRRDGGEHKHQRTVLEPSFRPGTVANHWTPRFERIAEELISGIEERGSANLFTDFAAPMASRCLMEILGLTNVSWEDLCVWSQSLMDAVANYGDKPEVWERGRIAAKGIEDALAIRIDELRANPDPSVISSMINAEEPLALEHVKSNVKVICGGGLNEPRDAACTLLYGLLTHPDQLEQVMSGAVPWKQAFEESIRWIAPIGMYPRSVAKPAVLSGIQLEPGMAIGLTAGSACRDERHFTDADSFNINRERHQHLGFGSGPHFCLGAWIARKQVGEIGVPMILRRLKNLRLDAEQPPRIGGWVFRGPLSLHVVWDPA